jgi:hypothetical protein
MRVFAALAGVLLAFAALAQGPGDGDLRTTAPSPSAPERAMPGEPAAQKAPAVPPSAAPADNRANRAAIRCEELKGALREQCLLEQQGAAAGASAAPEPRTAPPPQNPQ